jgi:catecholate siderophore receptor
MAHIRSRKHAHPAQPFLSQSVLALTALALPLAGHAQTTPAAEPTLSEVKVQDTETASGPYKAEKSANVKHTQPLVDTPQTVTIIKKEVMEEQGVASIMDALRNTPGITMQLGENGSSSAGDTFQMRGYAAQTSIFVDGIRDLGAVTRDTFNIDQIEVVKGPAGADIGRGATSGYVNLITKLPTREDMYAGSSSVTTAGSVRQTADLNKAVGETTAIRLNAMVQDGGVPGRDKVENNGYAIAPSIGVGLGTPTRFYLYSQHVRQDNVPDGGLPTIGLEGFYSTDARLRSGGKVDTENYYGSNSDYEKVDADMVTAKFEHDLAPGTTLRNMTRYGKTTMDRVMTGIYTLAESSADPATWTVSRLRQRTYQENEILANQTSFNTEFATGFIKHSLATGMELMYEKQYTDTFSSTGLTIPAANLYNPNAGDALPTPYRTGAYTDGDTTTVAGYLFDTLKLSPHWQIDGGIRFEHFNTSTEAVSVSTATSNPSLPVGTLVPSKLQKSGNLASWKVGAVYKPVEIGSIYAAYANSKTPPGSANFSLSATTGNINSPDMDAQETRNAELGTKWDLLNKKLGLTAALYRTENKNEISQLDAVTNTYEQLGERRVQGIELTAVGQITPAWQVTAGLATMSTKLKQGSTGNTATGASARWSPTLTGTLWSTYRIGSDWTVGGGARYASEQKRVIDPSLDESTQLMPNIPSYWVADTMVRYQATKNVSLQLNVYNLFDKEYISTLNNSGARYTAGAPRSATFTASYQF